MISLAVYFRSPCGLTLKTCIYVSFSIISWLIVRDASNNSEFWRISYCMYIQTCKEHLRHTWYVEKLDMFEKAGVNLYVN